MAALSSIKARQSIAAGRIAAALGEPLPPRRRNIPLEFEFHIAEVMEFFADKLERRAAEAATATPAAQAEPATEPADAEPATSKTKKAKA